jgi:hypothetical protein
MVSAADSAPVWPVPLPGRERFALRVEIAIVLVVTFGASGANAALSLIQSALAPGGLGGQSVALNPSRAAQSTIDLLFQLLGALSLLGWGALGGYLLWRSGIGPRAVGLGRIRLRGDVLPGMVLAAVIGLPGLGLYLIAHALGVSVTIVPSSLGDHWWRLPMLVLAAAANAVAEEVVVVGYLITRLRTLGWPEHRAIGASALLRGSYHLYQGLGGGLGNLVMGLVFGTYWARTTAGPTKGPARLWPLVLAHALIDSVAYIGYTVLHGHVSWLP